MKIILKRLSLHNFKGIKELTVDFNEKQSSIFGANEAGKTTLFDAFTWLLFGKDSQDRKDFSIKNTKFPELNRQEHQVSAVMLIDGEEVEIKRLYKEKWTKKKGQTISEMTGNEQEFYWNGVPMKAGEFSSKVSSIVEETVFKLITNPLYFNSLNWTKRRDFLFKLAGNITDQEVANGNEDFEILLETKKQKSLEELKRELTARKKKFKEDLEAIPTRIDEVSKSLPAEKEWHTIEAEIKQYEQAIADIDILISDKVKANQARNEAIQKKQNQLHNAKSKIRDIEYSLENDFKALANKASGEYSKNLLAFENKVEEIKRNINSKQILVKTYTEKREGLALRKENLKEMFMATDAQQLEFEDNDFCCPTCKRAFEAADIDSKKEELMKNFMADKNKALDSIEERGVSLKKEISDNDALMDSVSKALATLELELSEAQKNLSGFKENNQAPETKVFDLNEAVKDHQEYQDLMTTISSLEEELSMPAEEVSENADLQRQKSEIYKNIDACKKESADQGALERGRIRIQELKNQESDISQQLADLEMVESTIDAFNKAKVEAIESRVNEKFQYVRFKMYDYTIEGNPVETCETMYKDVPFSDLNNAAKVWAGLDIINTLSNHYQVFAPIVIDNRESITAIPFTESQVINLIVSEADKELRVA